MDNSSKRTKHRWRMALLLPGWVFFGFVVSAAILRLLSFLLVFFDISFDHVNPAVLTTVYSALVYLTMIAVVILLPRLILKIKINRFDLGLFRFPTWSDIAAALAGYVMYVVPAVILMMVVLRVMPGIDMEKVQDVGFLGIIRNYEYALAFLTLVVIAPVAEEIIFRGYLLNRLGNYVPFWLSILIVSVVFGLIHGNVVLAVDTFVLSVVLCVLRRASGSLWSPILLHMTKNGIAYYILFIGPLIR